MVEAIVFFIYICYNNSMDGVPKPRYPEAKAHELAASAEALQKDAFYDSLSTLESDISNRFTPNSIRSTFQLDGLEPSLENPLPELLARYHEVGAIKGVQIHFDANVDSHTILADVFIAVNADTIRTINIGPSSDDKKVYSLTENGQPLDGDMSQPDIEDILLSILLPPHTRKLIEAQRIYNGDSKLDLKSPKTFHLLSQVLRSRSKKAVEVREYILPATAQSTPSRMEVIETNNAKEIVFESGSNFIDTEDGVDEIKFTVSALHHTDLNIYEEIKVSDVTMIRNGTYLETVEPMSEKTKGSIVELSIGVMFDTKRVLP